MATKDEIVKLFDKFNDELSVIGLEIDNHAEFVSLLKNKNTGELIALLYDDNEIEWLNEK